MWAEAKVTGAMDKLEVDASLSSAHCGYQLGRSVWDSRTRRDFVVRMRSAGVPPAELTWVDDFGASDGPGDSTVVKRTSTTKQHSSSRSAAAAPVGPRASTISVGPVHVAPYKHRLRAFAEFKGVIPSYHRERRYAARFVILADYWTGVLAHCTWRGGLIRAFEEPSLRLPSYSDQGTTIDRGHFLLALGYAVVCPEAVLDAGQWRLLCEDLFELFDPSGCGRADYREFVAALQLFKRPAALDVDPEQLAAYFYSAYDGRAAGGLPPDEFLAMLCTLCTSSAEVAAIRSLVDIPAALAICHQGRMPRSVARGTLMWKRYDAASGDPVSQPSSQLKETMQAYQEARRHPNAGAWGYGLSSSGSDVKSSPRGDGHSPAFYTGVNYTTTATTSTPPQSVMGDGKEGEDGDDTHAVARLAEKAQAMAAEKLSYRRNLRPGRLDEAAIHLVFRLQPQLSHVIHRQRLARSHASQRAGYMRKQLALELEKAQSRYGQARLLVGEERAAAWVRFVVRKKALEGWRAYLHDKRVRRALVTSFLARSACHRWCRVARSVKVARKQAQLASMFAAVQLEVRAFKAWKAATVVAKAM